MVSLRARFLARILAVSCYVCSFLPLVFGISSPNLSLPTFILRLWRIARLDGFDLNTGSGELGPMPVTVRDPTISKPVRISSG
jgi:hypothetical protein